MKQLLELCTRAVIQHLGGNMKQFIYYRDKAIDVYKQVEFEEKGGLPIKYLIPQETVNKLETLVN